MTVTSVDPTLPTEPQDERVGTLARMGLAVFGAGLSFSAFGLWLTPGANVEPELSLMKLGVSVFMLVAGVGCVIASRPATRSAPQGRIE